ncbi:LPS O-antigen chain length determinant protein WzzB [Pseudomonas borbori]
MPAVADEIDLIELFQGLWQQRLLIIAFTVVTALAAAAFAFFSAPTYETKAGVLPPRLSDIASYNVGRSEADLSRFKVEDVYSVFKNNLLSTSLKRSFFREVYLSNLTPEQRGVAQDQLWASFNSAITVRAPDVKLNPGFYEIMVVHQTPELAAEWVNLYVDMAATKTEKDMQDNVLTEIAAKTQEIERKIDALRITAQKLREDRIVRLREALVVAEAVSLEAPQVVAGKTSSDGDLAEFIDGNLMYMRGAKAVRAELDVLEKRENDDPFISELRGLENRLDFLKKIDVNADKVSVFTLDSPAEVPETPVEPKKKLIVVVGVFLGGVLGVSIALVRILVRKYKLSKFRG